MKRIFLILLVMLVSVPSLMAQDEEPACDIEQAQTSFGEVATILQDFADQIQSTDDVFAALLMFQTFIESQRAVCGGNTLSSEDYDNGIIGPILFSGTLYQVTLSSTGGESSFSLTDIEGDCDTYLSIFTNDLTETDLWEPGGDCVGLIEVNTYGADSWTITFERLR